MDGLTDEVFVAPPGWPQPPPGWEPTPDWRPDPGWPPAPAGWQFWQSPPDPHKEIGRLRRENAVLRTEIRRLESAVEASNAELRRVLGIDPGLLRAETERMLRDRDAARVQLQTTLAHLDAVQRQPAAAPDSRRWA